MAELKVGVLALVHGLVEHTKYNGMCVELLYKCTSEDEIVTLPTGQMVRMDLEYCWLCSNPQLITTGVFTRIDGYGAFLSRNLLPIGDKDPDLEKDLAHELRKSTEYS